HGKITGQAIFNIQKKANARLFRAKPKIDYMKAELSSRGAFTLVEIMIVIAIVGLLAGIAVPSFLKARTIAQTNTCINHLRQIDAAIQEWATENKKGEQQTVQFSD